MFSLVPHSIPMHHMVKQQDVLCWLLADIGSSWFQSLIRSSSRTLQLWEVWQMQLRQGLGMWKRQGPKRPQLWPWPTQPSQYERDCCWHRCEEDSDNTQDDHHKWKHGEDSAEESSFPHPRDCPRRSPERAHSWDHHGDRHSRCYDSTGSSGDKSLGGAWVILRDDTKSCSLVLVWREVFGN